MITRRHTKLFFSMVAVVVAYTQGTRAAEENPALFLRNDLSGAIDLYIASEKSTSDSPWHHFHLEAGDSHKVNVVAPIATLWCCKWETSARDRNRWS